MRLKDTMKQFSHDLHDLKKPEKPGTEERLKNLHEA